MRTALSVGEAVTQLAEGGLVGFPTETSWGLAADATSDAALAALRAFKGRDAEKPISLLVADAADLSKLGADTAGAIDALVAAFWPGPLTMVLRCSRAFPSGIAGPEGAVGIRCSPHPVARDLARAVREAGIGPVTATSLNLSGEPDCTDRASAERLVGEAVHLVAGEDAGARAPSTVVDVSGARPRILREGAIPRAQLARFLPGELAA